MRVSILIMAFLPPLRALTSASSAREPVSLHWASNSFLSFSRAMASSCSHLSSSARRAASTIALAAFSSDSLASLVISSRSLWSWLYSDSSFLEAVLHGGSLAVSGDFGVGSGGLGLRLGVNLDLGISDLELVLLDGGLGLSVTSDGVF